MKKTWSIQALADATGIDWHTARGRLDAAQIQPAKHDGNGPRYAGPEAFPAIFGKGPGHELRKWETERKILEAGWEMKELALTRARKSTVPNPLVGCAVEIVMSHLRRLIERCESQNDLNLVEDRLFTAMEAYLETPAAALLQKRFTTPPDFEI